MKEILNFLRYVYQNSQMGIYREYNMPLPLLLTKEMTGYAVGDRGRVEQILRKHVKYIGKKNAYGKGKVIDVKVDWSDDDYSMYKDGIPTRWLPADAGTRMVRIRPPYWSIYDRCMCAELVSNWYQ